MSVDEYQNMLGMCMTLYMFMVIFTIFFRHIYTYKDMKKKPANLHSNWRWHTDEVFVKINGETYYLWRAIDHEGTVLDCYASKKRDKKTEL